MKLSAKARRIWLMHKCSAKPAVLGGALRAESSSGPRRPFGYLDTIGHSNRPFNRLSNGFIRIVQEAFDSASHGKDLDLEHRLLTPDGSIKVHVLGHALTRERAKPGFVGAVMDITTMKNAMEDIQAMRDQLYKENLVAKRSTSPGCLKGLWVRRRHCKRRCSRRRRECRPPPYKQPNDPSPSPILDMKAALRAIWKSLLLKIAPSPMKLRQSISSDDGWRAPCYSSKPLAEDGTDPTCRSSPNVVRT